MGGFLVCAAMTANHMSSARLYERYHHLQGEHCKQMPYVENLAKTVGSCTHRNLEGGAWVLPLLHDDYNLPHCVCRYITQWGRQLRTQQERRASEDRTKNMGHVMHTLEMFIVVLELNKHVALSTNLRPLVCGVMIRAPSDSKQCVYRATRSAFVLCPDTRHG